MLLESKYEEGLFRGIWQFFQFIFLENIMFHFSSNPFPWSDFHHNNWVSSFLWSCTSLIIVFLSLTSITSRHGIIHCEITIEDMSHHYGCSGNPVDFSLVIDRPNIFPSPLNFCCLCFRLLPVCLCVCFWSIFCSISTMWPGYWCRTHSVSSNVWWMLTPPQHMLLMLTYGIMKIETFSCSFIFWGQVQVWGHPWDVWLP